MINLEKIKQEKRQSLTPFEEDLRLHHTSTPFFNFSSPPPPSGGVIKILFLPFKNGDGWVRTMIDNYNCWNSLGKCIKMKLFIQKDTIIYSKINMNVVKTILLWQQFANSHQRKYRFLSERPQKLLSAEGNFEGCLMVKDYMTLILLLYCIKR